MDYVAEDTLEKLFPRAVHEIVAHSSFGTHSLATTFSSRAPGPERPNPHEGGYRMRFLLLAHTGPTIIQHICQQTKEKTASGRP